MRASLFDRFCVGGGRLTIADVEGEEEEEEEEEEQSLGFKFTASHVSRLAYCTGATFSPEAVAKALVL